MTRQWSARHCLIDSEYAHTTLSSETFHRQGEHYETLANACGKRPNLGAKGRTCRKNRARLPRPPPRATREGRERREGATDGEKKKKKARDRVRSIRSDKNMFAYGWPKVLASGGARVVALEHDERSVALAVVTASDVEIWSCGQVRLGSSAIEHPPSDHRHLTSKNRGRRARSAFFFFFSPFAFISPVTLKSTNPLRKPRTVSPSSSRRRHRRPTPTLPHAVASSPPSPPPPPARRPPRPSPRVTSSHFLSSLLLCPRRISTDGPKNLTTTSRLIDASLLPPLPIPTLSSSRLFAFPSVTHVPTVSFSTPL